MIDMIDWDSWVRQSPIVPLVLAFILAMTAILATQIRKASREAGDIRIKQSMIERGFGADEIERVVRAGSMSSEHRIAQRAIDASYGHRHRHA